MSIKKSDSTDRQLCNYEVAADYLAGYLTVAQAKIVELTKPRRVGPLTVDALINRLVEGDRPTLQTIRTIQVLELIKQDLDEINAISDFPTYPV